MCALEFQINYTLEWNEKKIDCSYKKKKELYLLLITGIIQTHTKRGTLKFAL